MPRLPFVTHRLARTGLVIALLLLTMAALTLTEIETPRAIDLSSIVATSPQAQMQYIYDVLPTAEKQGSERSFASLSTNASNVFLVDATNSHDAVTASLNVFFGPMSAGSAATVNTAEPKRGGHWLVAYLGLGPSQPRWFVVESVTVKGHVVRLIYHMADTMDASRDVQHYCYWIPLGTLDVGTYYVELYDSRLKAATLSRRVTVTQ